MLVISCLRLYDAFFSLFLALVWTCRMCFMHSSRGGIFRLQTYQTIKDVSNFMGTAIISRLEMMSLDWHTRVCAWYSSNF